MNQSQEKALRYLTGYDSLDLVPVETLKKLVDEDPYFPIGHYLLTKKLRAEGSEAYTNQVQTTALYFSNPLWLDYQLQGKTSIRTDSAEITAEPVITDEITSNEINPHQETAEQPITTVFSANELIAASDLAHETLQESPTDELAVAEVEGSEQSPVQQDEPPVIVGLTEAQTTLSADQLDQNFDTALHPDLEATVATPSFETSEANEAIEAPIANPEQVEPGIESTTENLLSQPEEETAAITRDVDERTEQFVEKQEERAGITHITGFDETVDAAQTPEAKSETIEVAEEMIGVTHETDDATEAFLAEAPPVTEQDLVEVRETVDAEQLIPQETENSTIENGAAGNGENDEHERMFLNIKAMLDASADEANADTENDVIPIDPYYTIDYFASQGIKLDFDANPQDQLGRNLKKFTQWLKHMKKLGPEDALETMKGGETEEDIQQIADSSNTIKEVVTEAMAAVLEKQGKKAKAVELYNKLIFLNPDKSTYFADKIKNLKGI